MADDEKVMKILKGKLTGTEFGTNGTKKNGDKWEVYNLTLDIKGKKTKIGSFSGDHKELKNKYVKVQVEVKQDGKYTNYTLKKIEELDEEMNEETSEDDGESIIDNEEEIVDDEEKVGNDITEKEGRKMDNSTPEGKKKAKKIMEEVKGTDWIAKEKRSMRAMSTSYAKDMFCQSKIEKSEVINMAESIYNYIWNGLPKE